MASKNLPAALGFIGLGNMGSVMATNLARYAEKNQMPRVRVWNRTRSKIEHMVTEEHCEVVNSLEEMVQKCEVIHTCLANDDVAQLIYGQLFAVPDAKGTIFVDHSTLFPTTSTSLQADAETNGMHYLACPVFGPPAAAKAAGLLIVTSGARKSRELVTSYIVPTLGKGTIDCGDDASKGALLKILGNNCILGTIELLSEAFTLAEKNDFDVKLFYSFVEQWFPAAAWVNYGKKIRDGTFSGKTGFTIPGGMKDAAFIRRLGVSTSTPTPIIDQAWSHLAKAKELGGEGLDWSACAAGMRASAGLHPFKGEDFSLTKVAGNGDAGKHVDGNRNGHVTQ